MRELIGYIFITFFSLLVGALAAIPPSILILWLFDSVK
jgi:hypothetical protein